MKCRSRLSLLPPLLVQSFFWVPAWAQGAKIFQWQFTNNAISQNLPSCQSFDITIKSYNTSEDHMGVGPYYMLAFPIGGTPTVQHIGDNISDLSWTVDQPPDSQLFLSVIDSNDTAGGVPPRLYNVVTGQSTSCIQDQDNNFTVSANVTDEIETCQPWGLRINGGTPPYNVSFMAINSLYVTNVTLGPVDDAFTYIDRADPGSQLIAGVSDLQGRWAHGSPAVRTTGSSDVSCVGLVSGGGTQAELDQEEKDREQAERDKEHKRTATILGCVLGLGIPLLLGIAGFFWWRRRRNGGAGGAVLDSPNLAPTAYYDSPRQTTQTSPTVTVGANKSHGSLGHGYTNNSQMYSPDSTASGASRFNEHGIAPHDAYAQSQGQTTHEQTSNAGSSHPGRNSGGTDPAAFPGFTSYSNSRRSAKAAEAALHAGGGEEMSAYHPSTSRQLPPEPNPGAYPMAPLGAAGAPGADGHPADEVIFQHRDAGPSQPIVRELPPPYIDRSDDNPHQA
ncbi:uncharacterized protein SCHCODRAFT_02615260 [Schizophyllum commune H4-8]|uniref:Expressed protein n=1 Tax=Schizophyllum commune (strain H4-8 / FGSC 9210) TaxID=578458 RepID=D8PZZ9_SCHCM|nr:uncharacterized protein SCHCODRAFT_02615260 [Schizophyllum commune H4-8]KAI5896583.1 hypothetical protein SCHCODRAFT_02615260 [Schizophyllum commune H4-8]